MDGFGYLSVLVSAFSAIIYLIQRLYLFLTSDFLLVDFSIFRLVFSCNNIAISGFQEIWPWARPLLVSFFLLSKLFFCNAWKFQALLGKFSIPFLMVATWHFISARRWPLWLTSCSFPIFLMHKLFFPYVELVFRCIHVGGHFPSLLPTVKMVVGFGGSIVAANVLRLLFPKMAHVLFGGR